MTTADDKKEASAPKPAEAQPVTATPRRMAGVPAFLGGIGAAVLGLLLAQLVPEGWPLQTDDNRSEPLALQVDAQAEEIAALNTQLQNQPEGISPEALAALRRQIEAGQQSVVEELSATSEMLAAFEDRLGEIEKRPISGDAASESAVRAYQREVMALRDTLHAQRAEIDAILAETAAEAAAIEQNAALMQAHSALAAIEAALTSGAPFADELQAAERISGVTAPEALRQPAEMGVATLSALQDSFAPAARLALQAATKAEVEAGSVSRMGAFFRTQLGARSLEPREGDDADAILSRAEAALRDGQLAQVEAELANLPDAANAAIMAWQQRAQAHHTAHTALIEFTTLIGGE